ncbi:MAG: hypothetical protein V3V14_00030 [Saprospiraceae bacterium]
MKKFNILLLAFILTSTIAISQTYYYGIKGGLGLNMQKWNTFQRELLFTPLIDLMVESYDEMPSRLYAQLGFHTRGSAVRGFGFTAFNAYRFNNIALEIGGKRMITNDKKYNGYYMLGLRAEYNISTNLNSTNTNSLYNLVSDEFVNKFIYGASVGGGFEYEFSENKIIFVELSFNPDLAIQYEQLESYTYTDINGIKHSIRPQEVRNFSLELKVGYKFMQGYIDD